MKKYIRIGKNNKIEAVLDSEDICPDSYIQVPIDSDVVQGTNIILYNSEWKKASKEELEENVTKRNLLSLKNKYKENLVKKFHEDISLGYDYDGKNFGLESHDIDLYSSIFQSLKSEIIEKRNAQVRPYGLYEINTINVTEWYTGIINHFDELISGFEATKENIEKSETMEELENG